MVNTQSQDQPITNHPLGHTGLDNHSLDMEDHHLKSGQQKRQGPGLVRTVIMKYTQNIWKEGLSLAQETNMDLTMAMQETGLHPLSPIKDKEKNTDSLRLPIDSQALVPEEDEDLVMDTLHTPLDN